MFARVKARQKIAPIAGITAVYAWLAAADEYNFKRSIRSHLKFVFRKYPLQFNLINFRSGS
jgi:hypothetical protein